jgi:hypothetical protein
LIGHSFGAQVAEMIGLYSVQEGFGVLQQITLLDPSSDLGTASVAQFWQGKNIAAFVDQYSTSEAYGSARALGNDDFVVTNSSTGFATNPIDEVDAADHDYAYSWYITTIMAPNSPSDPLNFGWNWHAGSWLAATEQLADYSSDTTGAWKGIIYGPENYLEAFSPGLNTDTYSDEWDYPGPWASTPPDTTGLDQMLNAIRNSFELSIESADVPTEWQADQSQQISFTFQNNDIYTIVGDPSYYADVYHDSYYLSNIPDLSGAHIYLGSDDQFEPNDSKAIDGITVSPTVQMASIVAIDDDLGASGPYYLILDVEPVGSLSGSTGTDPYPSNNLYATNVFINGQGFAANAGGDQVGQDEGDGNGATVTLDGSNSGPNVAPGSYVWTEGDTVLATGTPTCTAHFSDGDHEVTLTVTGPGGVQDSDTATITVLAPPPQMPLDGPPSTTSTAPVGPHDPNAMIGPAGYGSSSFVADTGIVFPYQIDFENSPTATGPAQIVTITDQLDPNLNWSTFQLNTIAWGNIILSIPAGSQHYETTVPMTYNGETFDVEVEAGIHTSTGQVYATFQSVDPDTELPPDILTGFLPPEDGTGRGMGYIGFTIQPKTGLPTGTQIRNVALITFDENGAIATDQINDDDPSQGVDPSKQALLTIDSGAPTSSVAALPAVSPINAIPVSWSGSDDAGGSGIASYTIYTSDDNGPFTPWLTATTLTSSTYVGQDGHTYGFYSVATDNVGNVQLTPAAAQATTTVDATPPTSSVAVLPSFNPGTFTLTWSGSDSNGIGIASYSVYVSDNDGTFSRLLTNTPLTSTAFTGVNGHTYGFYTTATDNLGNVQPAPAAAQASTTVDAVAPSSAVAALPAFSLPTFMVSWSGSDNPGGSGLANYSVYVSDNGGAFTPLLTSTTLTATTFAGVNGHTYTFYSVAVDNVGNRQATPAGPQAGTTVDGTPPTSSVGALPAFSPGSFTVSWSGSDGSGSGIASYDIYVSEDGGAVTAFLTGTTETSATFTGQYGHTYSFYSVGTDVVGNRQATPSAPEASTFIAAPPTSTVNPLPASEATPSFTVSWSGTPGAGATSIASLDIYLSDNGAAFTPFLTGTTLTSATFNGVAGHTYAFYSVATDNLGQRQAMPSAAEATTAVAAATSGPTNVTSAVSITLGGYTLNRSTNKFVQTITITNTTGTALSGPLSLVLTNLTSNATLASATGTTVDFEPGSPYVALNVGTLDPGDSITVVLQFSDPTKQAIDYDPLLLAGSGTI